MSRARMTLGGIVRPICLAAFRLMISQTPKLLQCKDSETALARAEVAEKTDEKGKQDDQPVAYIFFARFAG